MRRFALTSLALTALALTGCMAPYRPPAAPAEAPPMAVAASFGRTWDAVIDIFSERNIGIQTLDRSSGLIVAAPLRIPYRSDADIAYGTNLADCGATGPTTHLPGSATYNVVVRGDSTSSTVKVNVRFLHFPAGAPTLPSECSSRGLWEMERSTEVRERAERAR